MSGVLPQKGTKVKLSALLATINAVYHGNPDTEVTAIVSDSRKLCPGCAFVCIKGGRHDGHDFAEAAIRAGAAAVITERSLDLPAGAAAVVSVPDTREALSYMWDAWYGHPSEGMTCIGITGTNGKTTTSYAIKAILEAAGHSVGVIGTLGTMVGARAENLPNGGSDMVFAGAAMTTPDPEVLYRLIHTMKNSGVDTVVMEVSSHALAQKKVAPILFDAALFLNLGEDHLDFHITKENYFKSKASLFRQCKQGIVNYDDPYGRRLSEETDAPIRFCSACEENEGRVDYLAAHFVNRHENGIEYKLVNADKTVKITSPIIGAFNQSNTLMAAACALALGVGEDSVRTALKTFGGVEGRMERVYDPAGACPFSVIIDYAHTPEAMHNAIECLGGKHHGRIMTLFGCGGDRDPSKRPKMGKIGVTESDFAIITSDNCRTESPHAILSDILMGVGDAKNYVVICDRAEAIRYAMDLAREGDILLLLGKGHEKYEITAQGKIPFDEKQIVLEAYQNLAGR